MSVSLCEFMSHVCKCRQRPEEGLESLTGPMTSAKLPDTHVKNQICIFWRSSELSYPQNHFQGPYAPFELAS